MKKPIPLRKKKTPPQRKIKPVETNSGSNTQHALLSPSGSSKWLKCPASIAMEVGTDNTSGEAAVKGTVMHYVAECALNNMLNHPEQSGGKDAGTYVGCRPMSSAADSDSPEAKTVFTADMAKGITPYINYVTELAAMSDAVIYLEQRVDLTDVLRLRDIAYVDPETGEKREGMPTFGTADLVALVPTKKGHKLIVGDLKTGRGKVYAEGVPGSKAGNTQLMLYAAGLYKRFTEDNYVITSVELQIHAPYMGFPNSMDSFEVHPVSMKTFPEMAANAAKKAVECWRQGKKNLTAADFNPGETQCAWCRAASFCAAKSNAVHALMSDDTPPAAPDKKAPPKRKPATSGNVLDADAIAANYAKIPALKQFIASAEKAMSQLMFTGDGHKDYKLVAGAAGRRAYADESAVAAILHEAGVPDSTVYTNTLLSPAQMEKEVTTAVWAKIQAHIKKGDSKPVIALADDPRPTWVAASDDDLNDE